MKLAALILATASAVQMVHPGYQEVALAVHVVDHDGTPVDEWIAIDAIQDENADNWEDHDDGTDGDWSDDEFDFGDHEDPWYGVCENVYTSTSVWHDATLEEDDVHEHTTCYDDCLAAGGRVEDRFDQGEEVDTDGTVYGTYHHTWQECVVDDCDGFEHSYTWVDEDGTDVVETWCDYSCKVSGGHLVEETDEWGTHQTCAWGEDLEDCASVYYSSWSTEADCDTWCVPNSGVLDEDGYCHWANIDDDM